VTWTTALAAVQARRESMGQPNPKNEMKGIDLAAIRARRAAATQGDWTLDRPATDGPGMRFKIHVVESGGRITVLIGDGAARAGLRRDDAVFVSNAPRDIDALFELVDQLLLTLLEADKEPGGLLAEFKIDAALTAAGLPDQLSRDMKLAEFYGAREGRR
jgi:hypothetical protein